MRVTALLICAVLSACDNDQSPSVSRSMVLELGSVLDDRPKNPDGGTVRVELLDPDQQPPMFVTRGGPRSTGRLVFLHGMCGHGLGYAQSFQFSAAKKGTLIAPQGDVSCGGPWSKWSNDVEKLDTRIVETFRTLGHADRIDDIAVIGMSQGASRAEALARRFPTRYTRLVSMAGPTALKPGELRGLRAAVFMAGERDRRDLMQQSERAMKASGVPATFMIIPDATHGAMGPHPERTMNAALEWLWEHSKPLTAG